MIHYEKRRPCYHAFDEITVEGFTVYCSSVRYQDDVTRIVPDFGLYADYRWRPFWRNEFIDWPDFSVPNDLTVACKQISDAYDKCKDMQVEIGCIGAHGRTGTILSCMLVKHLDISSEEAIDMARDIHCPSAVETEAQEMFVEFFRRTINNG